MCTAPHVDPRAANRNSAGEPGFAAAAAAVAARRDGDLAQRNWGRCRGHFLFHSFQGSFFFRRPSEHQGKQLVFEKNHG